jgi:SAM-dependent methyltransferase
VSRSDESTTVRAQYASEHNLRARAALWSELSGSDAKEALWRVIAACGPRRVLEVGGGEGALAQRTAHELGATVVMIDQSERMVELAAEAGVDARVADVQELPFADESFDLVVAAWMLYHVTDLERGLAEIARVLTPGGRLVAVTNSVHHAQELFDLIDYPRRAREKMFNSENGEASLRRHFADVSRTDLVAWATVRDRHVLVDYRNSLSVATTPVPEDVELPFRVGARTVVFVAAK